MLDGFDSLRMYTYQKSSESLSRPSFWLICPASKSHYLMHPRSYKAQSAPAASYTTVKHDCKCNSWSSTLWRKSACLLCFLFSMYLSTSFRLSSSPTSLNSFQSHMRMRLRLENLDTVYLSTQQQRQTWVVILMRGREILAHRRSAVLPSISAMMPVQYASRPSWRF